mmetsp:Transcript_106097/g.298904  ORF Transcript_106097/g.298904 Transcript_106097/m.298904 type:complete len:359 (+) Transcript_106097:1-1077(+)
MRQMASQAQVVLAAFLADHWRRGAASSYAPWLEVVPKDYPSCPTLWTKDQLRCLAATEEFDVVVDKQTRWLEEYQTLLHFVPGLRDISYADLARARVAVESRTHGVVLGEPPVEQTSFVPFADLMNHNATFSALWKSERTGEQQGFRVTVQGGAKLGSPLLCSYGRKELNEFVRTYGFADEAAPREVSLQLELPRDDPYRALRQGLLLELGAYRTFTVRSVAPAMDLQVFGKLLTFAQVVVAEPEDLEEEDMEKLSDALRGKYLGAALEFLARAAGAARTAEKTAGAVAGPDAPHGRLCLTFRALRGEVFAGVVAFAREPREGSEEGVVGEVARSLRALHASAAGAGSGGARQGGAEL